MGDPFAKEEIAISFWKAVKEFAEEMDVSPNPRNWDKETTLIWFENYYNISPGEALQLYNDRNK